jgi:hypothetical protein
VHLVIAKSGSAEQVGPRVLVATWVVPPVRAFIGASTGRRSLEAILYIDLELFLPSDWDNPRDDADPGLCRLPDTVIRQNQVINKAYAGSTTVLLMLYLDRLARSMKSPNTSRPSCCLVCWRDN